MDASLFKNFSLTEKSELQFRVEAFNLFNTPEFSLPYAAVDQTGSPATSTTPLVPSLSGSDYQHGACFAGDSTGLSLRSRIVHKFASTSATHRDNHGQQNEMVFWASALGCPAPGLCLRPRDNRRRLS